MKASIIPDFEAAPEAATGAGIGRASLPQRLARGALCAALSRLEHGEVRLIDGDRERRFGRRDPHCTLAATLRVADPRFYAETAFGGSVGAGEAYIRGYWSCDDLTALIRIMVRNREAMSGLEGGFARLSRPIYRLFHWLNRNTHQGSARNIAAHYDLGNDLYGLMLDESMAYSCAIFPSAESTLLEASRTKFDAACRKLALQPSDHLLEIGTGWGGLAIHAARHYGCRVTTTTISRAQHEYARERIREAGLADRITLLLEDYRDLNGRYDKLVSIEMIEAVGADFLAPYFGKCAALLARDGAMLLQAITIQDQLYQQALRSVDYIQRYIFPGSFIPSVAALARAIGAASDLKIFHLEDIGPHYARTLAEWRRNFFAHLPQVRALGYPDSFIRLWEFYLCYCEGGFEERQLGDVQMLLTKPGCRRASIAAATATTRALAS
jgi:cyclopropane-fatty-acyl-phospholipid synthase